MPLTAGCLLRAREWFNGGMAAYGVYRCADGRHVAVGALEPQFFAALSAALDEPSLEEMHLDPARQDELRARLAEIFRRRPRDEWTDLLGERGCVRDAGPRPRGGDGRVTGRPRCRAA